MVYDSRKYISNKYPIASTETVAVISTVSNASRDDCTGIVFPKVPSELEIASDSKTIVINGMKHNLGEPLVKIADISNRGIQLNFLDNLKYFSRRGYQQIGTEKPEPIKYLYVNGALIEKVIFTQLAIPQDIIDKTKEYYDLGEKGNNDKHQQLNETDEKRFNELDTELDAYYGAAGTAGRYE